MRVASGGWWLGALIVAAGPLLGASPAGAVTVTPAGNCAGAALVNGTLYSTAKPGDASRANPMVIPSQGVVNYLGGTKAVTKPESGHLAVVVGPSEIPIYHWSSSNTKNLRLDKGKEDLTHIHNKLPVGIAGLYEIKGYHYDNGVLYCSGSGWVKFAESPLSTPVGIIGIAGTALFGLGVLASAFGKRVVA